MPEACFFARRELRNNFLRRTKYNTLVTVPDYLNPVLFVADIGVDRGWDRELDILRPLNQQQHRDVVMDLIKDQPLVSVSNKDGNNKQQQQQPEQNRDLSSALIGRESDILHLENTFHTSSSSISLAGPAGSGKSALARHLSWWWQTTGMIKGVLQVDFANIASLDWIDIVHVLCSQITSTVPVVGEAALLQHLKTQRYLVMFDSIDELSPPVSQSLGIAISGLTKPIRKQFRKDKSGSLFLFLGRQQKSPIQTATGAHETLFGNLAEWSSVELCLKILQKKLNAKFTVDNTTDAHHLEQIVSLLEGNPLAMELIMCDFAQHVSIGLCQYYQRLTSNKPIAVDDELTNARAVKQAAMLIKKDWKVDVSCPLPQPHIFYLSPYWRAIPLDIAPYWKFLEFAHGRVHASSSSSFSSRWLAADNLDEMERNFFYYEFWSVKMIDMPELIAFNKSFATALDQVAIPGFLGEKYPQRPRAAAETATHFLIHPILTICLRSLMNSDTDTPSITHRVILVAFQRFYRRQYLTYCLDSEDPYLRGDARALIMQRSAVEFENYISFMNFTFSVDMSIKTYSLIGREMYELLAKCHFRAMAIILPVLKRGIEYYTRVLAENAPTKSQLWIDWLVWRAKRTTLKVLGSKPLQYESDNIGALEGTLFSKTKYYCLVMLKYATRCSVSLGFESGKYSNLARQIQDQYPTYDIYRDANMDLVDGTEAYIHPMTKAPAYLEAYLGIDIDAKSDENDDEEEEEDEEEEDEEKDDSLTGKSQYKKLSFYLKRCRSKRISVDEILEVEKNLHKALAYIHREYGLHSRPSEVCRIHIMLMHCALNMKKTAQQQDTLRAAQHFKAMKDIISKMPQDDEVWQMLSEEHKQVEEHFRQIREAQK